MPCESIVKRDADAIFAIDPQMDPRYSPRLNCSSEGRVISLDLRDFNVTSLSPRVNDLTELLELRIDGNRQLGVLPEMPSLTKLQVLSANTTLLTAVPDLSAFTELVTLELGINRISSIPDSIGGCKKLKTLGVFGNEGLTELPPSVAGLCNLENLWMNACAFKALPDLSCMRNLTQLVANGNAIEVVPMSIGIDNPKLQILMLQENKIRIAPPSLRNLSKLVFLELRDNPIEVIPPLDGSPVVELFLSGLKIRSLPDLSSLPNLYRLDFSNNLFLEGAVSICNDNLGIINANLCPLFTGILPPPEGYNRSCLPSLTSINLADSNITSDTVEVLQGSKMLRALDISNNRHLDRRTLLMLRGLDRLRSIKAAGTGQVMRFTEFLHVTIKATSLSVVDLSDNPGISGVVNTQSMLNDLLWKVDAQPPVFPILMLTLDNTSVTYFEPESFAQVFQELRVLSLRNIQGVLPRFPYDFVHLTSLDVRGISVFGPPDTFISWVPPGTPPAPFLKEGFTVVPVLNASCPSAMLGGTLQFYPVFSDPWVSGFVGCSCLIGYFGEPRVGCSPCPEPAMGAAPPLCNGVNNGDLAIAHGSWFKVVAPGDRVIALPCPSDSHESPCIESRLRSSARSASELKRAVVTQCRPGYSGRLCSECAAGFFRSGRSCFRCNGALAWVGPVLNVLVLTLLTVKTVSGGHASRTGLIRTLILHTQLISLLPDLSLKLNTVAAVLFRLGSSGSGGLRFDGVYECLLKVDGFRGEFFQACLLPAVVVVGSLWIALLSGRVGEGRSMPLRSRIEASSLYLWLVLLFGALQKLLAPSSCTSYGSSSGKEFINAALWIPCAGPSYSVLFALSVVLSLLFTLTTVAVLARSLRPGADLSTPIGSFLSSPYSPESYYWEAVQFARRVVLAGLISLTRFNSPVQPVAVTALLVVSLLAHAWRRPFSRPMDNAFEAISLGLLVATYTSGLVASNPAYAGGGAILEWAVLILNIIFLGVLGFLIGFSKIRHLKITKGLEFTALSRTGDNKSLKQPLVGDM